MTNGQHTLDLVKKENERIITDMRKRLSSGTCGDTGACIAGFERVLDLIEMLFEISYEKKAVIIPPVTVYVPKSVKEALLIATTKSPIAVAAMLLSTVAYCIYFGKPLLGL